MSVAAVGGAGIGGYLIQLLTAPYALAVDALSYLWSAIWLRGIRTPEARPVRGEQRRLRQDIGDGLGYLFRQPILRAIALNVATVVLFQSAIGAITIVFLVREIGLGPAAIGLLSMIGLLAAVVASMVTSRIADKLGTARTMLAASILLGVAFLLLPLTRPGAGLAFFVASGALSAFTIIVLVVLQASARQQLCPEDLRGRVAATMNMLSWGMMPIGALIGGSLAGVLGLRGTIAVCAADVLAGAAWPVCSPLRSLRDVPLSPPSGRRSPAVAAPVRADDAGPVPSSPHGRTGPRCAAGSGR
jgi:Na+/melibiose symporter-like transporter